MVKAVPIDSEGNPNGPVQSFPDMQWNKMKNHFGKKFAWKEVSESTPTEKKTIKEVELIASPVSTKNAKKKKDNEK